MANSIRFLFCAMACIFSITSYAESTEEYKARIRQNSITYAQKVYGMSNSEATKKIDAGLSNGKVTQTAKFEGTSSDGSKIRAGATVTKVPDKAKVASTLVSRLAKAKDYAKLVGKASIPAFVGTAAFHGLMNGIDYVMDEGGKVTKKPTANTAFENVENKYTSDYQYYYTASGKTFTAYTAVNTCSLYYSWWNTQQSVFVYSVTGLKSGTTATCTGTRKEISNGQITSADFSVQRQNNPNKTSNPPDSVELTDAQLKTALQDALNSNNAALAAAIAEAIKNAYSPDVSQGQVIGDEATNGLAASSNADIKDSIQKGAANDGSAPGEGYGKPGYYKITDGEKTIEGYVYPSDPAIKTDTTTTPVKDPVTGNPTGSTTTTGSLQLPAFCDWASIVCDWIGWTKEEPKEPEEEKPVLENIDIPYTPFSIASFNATCPPDEQLSMSINGQEQLFILPMSPFCDFFSALKPFVIALASFFAVKLIGNGAFNSGN